VLLRELIEFLALRTISRDNKMRVRDLADGFDPDIDPFRGTERADHQNDEAVSWEAKLIMPCRAWLKAAAIDSVWNDAATPAFFVSAVEVRICANQPIAAE
jgi:hypothetical protein